MGTGTGGLAVGLLLGAGVALVWWSCWPRRQRSTARWLRPAAVLEDWLVRAGAESVSPWGLVGLSALGAAGVTAVATAVTGSPVVAACLGVAAAWAPVALVRHRARRRQADLRALWPDVVDNLASAVRAGLSLPEALAQVADRGPEPLRPAFARFARDYRATGRFADSLGTLKDGLADPVADRLVEALRITRDVGGTDVGRLLRTLSTFLREDLRTRGELEARQSWTVAAARLAVAAPWAVLAILSTRPGALEAYDQPSGLLVLVVGGAASVVAYHLMLRIGRLPADERVLR